MNSHYFVIADHSHLRIFTEKTSRGQTTPGLDEVYAMEFDQGRHSYTDNDTDQAGRFQGSNQQGGGMSIDERLPMQREAHRRAVAEISSAIELFLSRHGDATWDFSAGPTTHNAILERIPAAIRSRLRNSVSKDLVNHPVADLRERFLHPV